MTLKESVLKWNNAWRYDLWWRKKHNIPFNSEAHRNATQIEVVFEYFENELLEKSLIQWQSDQDKEKKLKETGQWMIKSTVVDKEQDDELWNKIDISKL